MRPRRGGDWLCFALVAACGCSALVDPAGLLVRCEIPDGGIDPCMGAGLVCTDGVCQKCKPEPELCDGRDNNCNGKIDEGFDADNDGFTWCGGGRQELIDCDPSDATVHPPPLGPDGRPGPSSDPCDGKDNDCDGTIDEDMGCEALHSCATSACPENLVCDPKSNQCIAVRDSGSACKSDAECGNGFCISTSALGLDSVLKGGLCGTACCSDKDCAEGSACVQSGSGARVCQPHDIAGRQVGEQGGACMLSSDCASGVCQRKSCTATCSRNADCGSETCRLNVVASSLLSGAGAWICGAAGGRGGPGDLCTSFDPTSCQSALCLGALCAAPCGSDVDCATGLACRYVSVNGLLGQGRVTACVDPALIPEPVPGTSCCTSADCSLGQTCRPKQQSATSWGMYCMGANVQ